MGTVFVSRSQAQPPIMKLVSIFLLLSLAYKSSAERITSVSTHTAGCFSCGMIEGTGYLTVKICGKGDCCLSRSLNNDNINWIPGQTDTFTGYDSLLECADYEVGDG